MKLKYNIKFNDLYERDGLLKIDEIFLNELKSVDLNLYNQLISARMLDAGSEVIMAIAPYLEDFVANLFSIAKQVNLKSEEHNELAILYRCKRLFIKRRALKKYPNFIKFDQDKMAVLIKTDFTELDYAKKIMLWLEDEKSNEENLDYASRYAAFISFNPQAKLTDSILFNKPKKLDFDNLVELESIKIDGITTLRVPNNKLKQRKGFSLTDHGMDLVHALDEAHYCIYCHHQNKDSCSKGMIEQENNFKKNHFNIDLTGCPLGQKISEMNELKANGNFIAALSVAMIDNPLIAATGHRICNDCMKSCIYQKQQPVNIPQIESRTLKDVLNLPWGLEIYSLLSRWNPLNFARPLPKPNTNYHILVAGLGPAGFTLAHHLLNEGHNVVGIDGLKIEPLAKEILEQPIKDINLLFEDLATRNKAGFGGVAEYGITVRWDKNYLKIIRLLLERRSNFKMYGSVRFGSTITYESSFKLGFDHIALALGAGKPNLPNIPNIMAKGVRTASDFLMSLQLTGANNAKSLANLQIRLPIIVIGGGLTALDTATEALAYYQLQVKKFLFRYEVLEQKLSNLSKEDEIIAKEFVNHAKQYQKGENPALNQVKVLYRNDYMQSPSFRLNHEEFAQSLQEGVNFLSNLTPLEIITDSYGYCEYIKVIDKKEHEFLIKARTILIATGTSPNNVIAKEDPTNFSLDGKFFQAIDINNNKVTPELSTKPTNPYLLTSLNGNQSVSFFGDLHPSYAGNVVKAMKSAKDGYPIISKILEKHPPKGLNANLDELFLAKVTQVIQLADNIIELIIKAPLAAREFKPGQFYRLQNYAPTELQMEALALTGASVDYEAGLISLIILEMGGSSNLCRNLKPDELVSLMGPTGAPTEIKANEQVLLIGGGLGNAVLFSIGKAYRSLGSKVYYVAGYKKIKDRFKIEEIEQAADIIIWCCDEKILEPTRAQDKAFHGNVIDAMIKYKDELNLANINRIIAIGSNKMMEAVNVARTSKFASYLNKDHEAIASVNSPMQCMMKEICATCLQRHLDPITGIESYVYSCTNQDQDMNKIDFKHLEARLTQNNLQEQVTKLWLSQDS